MAENIPIRPKRRRSAPAPSPVREVQIPDAPEHLSEESRALWESICQEWEIDAGSLPILRGALESWDAYQQCRREVAERGPTFTTETGMIRQNPAAKLALDNFSAFRMAMRQLGLEPGV